MLIHKGIYALLENPNLPVIMQRSAYSLDEIKAALSSAEQVKAEYEALCNRVGELIGHIKWYDRFDNEQALANVVLDNACIQGGTYSEPFPVKTWNRAIASQRAHNRRIEKALKEFEDAKTEA